MYIVQFEHDEPKICKQLSDAEYISADDGLLTIIDISNPEIPRMYSPVDGEWEELDDWN